MTCTLFQTFTARLQRLVGFKSKAAAAAEKRNSRTMHISPPFNFKHETVSLPGLSEDEITILKEKAAASRLGVAGANKDGSSSFGSPRKAPRAPPSPVTPVRTVAPVTQIITTTPLSPADNVI